MVRDGRRAGVIAGGESHPQDVEGLQHQPQLRSRFAALDLTDPEPADADLGRRIGFEPTFEVSHSPLALRLDDAYTPRVDVMWSLPITDTQSAALGKVLKTEPSAFSHLPIVGIEVEGTTPTTKTLASDVANIAALGTKLGFLMVSEASEAGIYRRAARAVRTLRRAFGDLQVIPMDASWLDDLNKGAWSSDPSEITEPPYKAPAGGETLDWSSAIRDRLRKLGKDAGFIVAEPHCQKTPWDLESQLVDPRQELGNIALTKPPCVRRNLTCWRLPHLF